MARDNQAAATAGGAGDIGDVARDAARRLRRVQISFADEPAERRRTHLSEELESLLRAVSSERRPAFLEHLESLFPAASGARPAEAAPAAPAAPASLTVAELASQLCARAAGLAASEREALTEQLAAAGLVNEERASQERALPAAGGGDDAQIDNALLSYIGKSLKVQHVDVDRLAKMAVMLSVYMGQLDQVVWGAWQAVAPQGGLKRKATLEKTMQSYLSGDRAVSGVDLNAQMATTKKLLTAFIAAIGQLGKQYYRQHLAAFSPDEIRIAARKGGNPFISEDALCWAHYQRQARRLEEGAVDDAIRDTLMKIAADMMKSP